MPRSSLPPPRARQGCETSPAGQGVPTGSSTPTLALVPARLSRAGVPGTQHWWVAFGKTGCAPGTGAVGAFGSDDSVPGGHGVPSSTVATTALLHPGVGGAQQP